MAGMNDKWVARNKRMVEVDEFIWLDKSKRYFLCINSISLGLEMTEYLERIAILNHIFHNLLKII